MPAARGIHRVALLVRDYDEAVHFYVEKLGFQLIEDTPLPEPQKRWVVVAADSGAQLLLARASDEIQLASVGRQAGGRVFMFLHTDNFQRDYDRMKAHGVEFMETPRREPYGTVAVFRDLYGNLFDLLEPAAASEGT